jgi:hypothetical protein|tara:strand:- start:1129 stop:1290 length:162 start_codon:yes stop_codon:yes gene_type:complete
MNNKRALEVLIKHACGEKIDPNDLQAAVLLAQSWLKKDVTVSVEGFTLNLKQE